MLFQFCQMKWVSVIQLHVWCCILFSRLIDIINRRKLFCILFSNCYYCKEGLNWNNKYKLGWQCNFWPDVCIHACDSIFLNNFFKCSISDTNFRKCMQQRTDTWQMRVHVSITTARVVGNRPFEIETWFSRRVWKENFQWLCNIMPCKISEGHQDVTTHNTYPKIRGALWDRRSYCLTFFIHKHNFCTM